MIKNFVLLTGPDSFRRGGRKRFYVSAFKNKYPDGEVEYFDAKTDFTEVSNAVLTPNLFGGRRLLVTDSFWTPDNFERAEKEKFFEALDVSTDLTLISVEPTLDKRKKATKWLMKNTKCEKFEHLSEGEIISWVTQEATNHGATMGRAEAQRLLSRCGENLHNLSQETQKLTLMAEDGVITTALIEENTISNPKVVLWDFLADLSHRRSGPALKKFRDLRTSGESTHYIFSMLIREIGIHARLRACIDQKLSESEAAKATKLHPYVVKKTLPLSRKFTAPQIAGMYEALENIDRRLKTGGISISTDDQLEFEIAIEQFILKFCRS